VEKSETKLKAGVMSKGTVALWFYLIYMGIYLGRQFLCFHGKHKIPTFYVKNLLFKY
jgi:hypothetical protein